MGMIDVMFDTLLIVTIFFYALTSILLLYVMVIFVYNGIKKQRVRNKRKAFFLIKSDKDDKAS
jgi:hypothetical protein